MKKSKETILNKMAKSMADVVDVNYYMCEKLWV